MIGGTEVDLATEETEVDLGTVRTGAGPETAEPAEADHGTDGLTAVGLATGETAADLETAGTGAGLSEGETAVDPETGNSGIDSIETEDGGAAPLADDSRAGMVGEDSDPRTGVVRRFNEEGPHLKDLRSAPDRP